MDGSVILYGLRVVLTFQSSIAIPFAWHCELLLSLAGKCSCHHTNKWHLMRTVLSAPFPRVGGWQALICLSPYLPAKIISPFEGKVICCHPPHNSIFPTHFAAFVLMRQCRVDTHTVPPPCAPDTLRNSILSAVCALSSHHKRLCRLATRFVVCLELLQCTSKPFPVACAHKTTATAIFKPVSHAWQLRAGLQWRKADQPTEMA